MTPALSDSPIGPRHLPDTLAYYGSCRLVLKVGLGELKWVQQLLMGVDLYASTRLFLQALIKLSTFPRKVVSEHGR